MQKVDNYIGGERLAPKTGRYMDSFNPATGEVHQQLADSGAEDVNHAVAVAKEAQKVWAGMSLDDRSKIMFRIGETIEDHLDELAELESRDQGKPVSLAKKVDIPRASYNFRFFSQAMTQFLSESSSLPGMINYVRRDPVGVTGLISPWNLPLYLLTWKIAPAIAAGNACVAKPSEFTSATASRLCDLLNGTGLPKGLVNMVFGTGAGVGEPLVAHPDVPLVSFTGGTSTGARISSVAAPMFKKVSLELGGKNANVVFADADFEEAVSTSVRAAFTNQGEICLCGSRIFVQREIYDKFLEAFVAQVKELKVGDPSDESSFMGPVVSEPHMNKVLSFLDIAKKDGSRILCGGGRLEMSGAFSNGYFIAPTVIADPPKDSCLLTDEIFGPVCTVMPFDTESEVVEWANGTRYGLAASIWTQNIERAHRMAEAVHAGTVWINAWMLRDLRLPFGGMKDSGVGREGAVDSMTFFTEEKTVVMKYGGLNG